ncbi:hypothetical protein C5S53_05145 [Methanophagales archaeon]|nr:hypothetical protein C5S53_05145 [Methanophagales archaeon]
MDYVIVCAPAGTDLKGAVAKFKNAFGVNNVVHKDVEALLCGSLEAKEALIGLGYSEPSNHQDWPGIDDIYDMYLRLTDKDQLFDTQERIDRYLERIWDEVEDKKGPQNFPPNLRSSLIFEWKLCVLSNLLSWRHSEILMAESLARQLDAKFLLGGVKQPTKIVASWLRKSDSTLVYLSHPISRPRRQKIEGWSWPPIVPQFNELQDRLFEHNLVCVMPTAIDEYRIAQKSEEGTVLKRRLPVLEERWPLPATNIDSLLYSTPKNSADMHHKDLLTNKDPSSKSELADGEVVSTQLRALESQIMFQIASRDHLLLLSTNGLLVFRPFYLKNEFSHGVKAEIDHWNILTCRYSKDPNTRAEKREKEEDIDSNRRAAFIHFDVDISSFLQFAKSDEARKRGLDLDRLIDDNIVQRIGAEFSLADDIARDAYLTIEYEKSTSGLDSGRVHNLIKIKRALPEIKKEARITTLRVQLTGTRASSSKVGMWIVKDEKELGRYYEEIANFLKTKTLPPSIWEERAIDLWNKAEENPS